MCRKLILYTTNKNNLEIFKVKERLRSLNYSLIICDSYNEFFKIYNCNIIAVLFGEEDKEDILKIRKTYPKDVYIKIINLNNLEIELNNLDIRKQQTLTNKSIMTYFLDSFYMYSTSLSVLIIKKTLINAVNLNLTKINSQILYYSCRNLKLNPNQEIPIIRDYINNWLKIKYPLLNNIYPHFNCKKVRVNNFIDFLLNIYKKSTDLVNCCYPYYSESFYIQSLYGKNFSIIKNITPFKIFNGTKANFKNFFQQNN